MLNMLDEESLHVAETTPPRLRIITDYGAILIELYPDRAPISVKAFLTEILAGTFEGGSFNRIVRVDNDHGSPVIEVIQGLRGGTPMHVENVPLESTADTGLRHEDGTISLPRLDGGHGTAQSFFICIGPQPALDQGGGRTADGLGFAAFGRVVAGMEIARLIHGVATSEDAPVDYLRGQLAAEPVTIHSITVDAYTAAAQFNSTRSD